MSDIIRESYSTSERIVLVRIAEALERIATALERTADADPLTMLDAVMGDGEHLPVAPELQPPIASNGLTAIYQHPDPDWQIVLRKDTGTESGYVASIERAH